MITNPLKQSDWLESETILLGNDLDIQCLGEMITEKTKHIASLEKKVELFRQSDNFRYLGGYAPTFREDVIKYIYAQEIEEEYNYLYNMTESWKQGMVRLGKRKEEAEPMVTKWEKAYSFATEDVNILDVVQHFIEVKNAKRNICCPFHQEKTPSFKIYTNRNMFICFGCGVKGGPVNFVMQYTKCSFKEAVLLINKLFS